LENPAAYLIRSSFSQQRMEYRPEEAEVTYFSKDRKEKKSYDAPEWLAAMGSHVPQRGQQSVRYYGAYANSTRGRERKRDADDGVPTVSEPNLCSREVKQNWSRLIRKVSAPVCPKIAFSALSSESTHDRIPGRSHCVFRILSLTQPTTTYGTSFSLTHKSFLSYSVRNRKKIPIDQGYKLRRLGSPGALQILKADASLFHRLHEEIFSETAKSIFNVPVYQADGRAHQDFRFTKDIRPGWKNLVKDERPLEAADILLRLILRDAQVSGQTRIVDSVNR
jgi:hypothetical protein